jgi:hypothetical protein
MNLTGQEQTNKVNAVGSTIEKEETYTNGIVTKLESLRDSLEYSSTSISSSLNRLVGNDTLQDPVGKSEVKKYDGEYGNIHAIIDDLFQLADINQENRLKLNRIV